MAGDTRLHTQTAAFKLGINLQFGFNHVKSKFGIIVFMEF